MSKDFTTPDPAELVRKQLEALDRGDLDGVMSSVAEDGSWTGGRSSLRVERRYVASLTTGSGPEELDYELEEVSQLGGGVVFAVVIQDGAPGWQRRP